MYFFTFLIFWVFPWHVHDRQETSCVLFCSFFGYRHVCVKWACFAFCYERNQYKDIHSFILWYTLSGGWKQLLLCMKEAYESNRLSVGAACIMRFYAMCQCCCLRMNGIFRVPFIASCTTNEIITKRSSRDVKLLMLGPDCQINKNCFLPKFSWYS